MSKDSHWNDLENEVRDEFSLFGAKKTKGSGNQKGDCDVKMCVHGMNVYFEGKSEEIPKGNVIIKQQEWDKMQEQVKAFFGKGIYVRRNKHGELIACLRLKDLRKIMGRLACHSG